MPIAAPQIQSFAVPERLPYGLAVDTYSQLPLNWVQADGGGGADRWVLGVNFVPRGIPTSTDVGIEDPCVVLENSFATPQGFDTDVTFRAVRTDNAVTCSTLGGFTQDELEAWIEAESRALESYDLARHVWGTGGPNPDLRDQADTITTGDVTPVGALAAVVGGLDRRLKGGRGLIHMTTSMLVRLVSAGAVVQRAGEWQTPNGHRIVADPGYDGSAPAGQQLGVSWIYGSGPVYFRASEFVAPGQWWESFNRVHNDLVAQVSRYFLYAFEPAYVVGAQSDVGTSIS